MDKLAIVNSSGVVLWTPHGRLRSYCNPDWSSFPFDTQKCLLAFGPWTYDRSLVNVSLNPTSKNHHRKFVQVRPILLLIGLIIIRPHRSNSLLRQKE